MKFRRLVEIVGSEQTAPNCGVQPHSWLLFLKSFEETENNLEAETVYASVGTRLKAPLRGGERLCIGLTCGQPILISD